MKKIYILAIVAIFGFSLTSCLEDDCKQCKIITVDTNNNDSLLNETSYTEYCSADLDEVDGQSSTDTQGIKTEYVCE